MELIIILIIFFVGFSIGFKFREYVAIRKFQQYNTEFNDKLREKYKENVIHIKVEDVNGVFFVYKKDDGSYLAHGENMTKLEDILNEKFPGKMFNATPEDLTKLESR
jgi:hypothetical protein